MIDRLRRRFTAIAMLAVFVVLLGITAFINLWNLQNVCQNADETLSVILQNDGFLPKHNKDKQPPDKADRRIDDPRQSPEAPFSTRYFSVSVDANGATLSVNTGNIAAVDTAQAAELAATVAATGRVSGFSGSYRYAVLPGEQKTLVAFLDVSRELYSLKTFFLNSLIVDAIGFAAVALLILLCAKAAVRPVAQSYQKQKRFVTDAGHEIKTPLAIILAGTEVLELEQGENQWTQSIRRQVERLSQLTAQLTALARMEEADTAVDTATFSLSDAVQQTAEGFLPLVQAQGKQLSLEVTPSLQYTGSEQSLRQLVSLLLDNAVKYSTPGATVALSLAQQGRQLRLQVSNPCAPINPNGLEQLFERFYRPDSSRNSQTGGYGLGLSIVQAIAAAHKGRVTAQSPDGNSLVITLRLPV